MKNTLKILYVLAFIVAAAAIIAACGGGGDKSPAGMSNRDFSGEFTAAILGFDSIGVSNTVWDGVFSLSADGAGNMVINSIALPGGASFSNTGTYSVSADGQFTTESSSEFKGILFRDGGVFVWADIANSNGIELGLGFRNSAGLTNSVLSGDYLCGQFGYDIANKAAWTHEISAHVNGKGGGDFSIINSSYVGAVGVMGPIIYSVADSGLLSIQDATGIVRSDGEMLAVADTDNINEDLSTTVCIKKTPGLNNTTLKGKYFLTQIGFSNSTGPYTTILEVTADGSGNGSFAFINSSDPTRIPTGNPPIPLSYMVNTVDGTLTVTIDGIPSSVTGIVEANGNMFTVVDTDPPPNNGEVELVFGIRY